MKWRSRVRSWRGSFDCLEPRRLLTIVSVLPAKISATQGSRFSGEVAAFIDDDISAPASDFMATIDWGDGSPVAAVQVVGTTILGFFEVDGSHTYPQEGSFSTNISVTDRNGQTKSAGGTADVGAASQPAASPLTVFGNAFTQTASTPPPPGQAPTPPPTQTVATFLDPNMADTQSDFNALINWGDGHSSAGTVQGGNGIFTVTGSDAYAVAGTYPFTVTIVGLGGALAGSASGTATVLSPYKPTGQPVVATAGLPFTATLADFMGTSTDNSATYFSGVINWGDGATGAATISPSGSGFSVTGSHTYANPGSFTITVTIADPLGNTFSVTDTAAVTNTNPPGGAPTPFNITGGLADVVGNGPYSAGGFTNTNRPTFSGTAAPYSTVQLYARHFNVDAQIPLGEAVANGAGQWTFTTGPLAVGTYIISATATAPGGYPSGLIPLQNSNGKQLVYIDLTPRLTRWLSDGKAFAHRRRHPHPRPPLSG